MFRPWRSFPTMVASGLVVGLASGGFPAYSREVSQVALGLAMTFSLTEISFAGISPRAEARGFLLSVGMSYVLLSGLLLVFAWASPSAGIHDGWVLMAAVPPAVAVIPMTSLLKGDVRRALISSALLYLMGLVLVPFITYIFAGRAVPIWDLALQTLLLIALPILVSRPLRRWSRISEVRPTAVGVSFFVLVLAIAGSTREALFREPGLLVSLAAFSFARTFGLGLLLLGAARAFRASRADQVSATTFSSFKNLGLAVVLAFSFFGPETTLPSIVSLVFEILWIASLPFLFRAERTPAGPSVAQDP